MKKHEILRPLLWSVLFIALFGCQKDSFLGEGNPDFAIQISYEEETRSSFSNLSAASGDKSDAGVLAQETQCLRQKIRIGIMEDGNSIMEVTRMKPKHAVTIPEKVSPTLADEVHSMRFINGQVILYDSRGKQIGQERAEMPSYNSFVAQVRQNKNNLSRAMYSDFLSLQQSKSTVNSNVNVTDQGDIVITETVITPEDGMDPSMNGYTVANYFETATGVLVGAAILDETGTTVYRSVMTYDEDESNPLPEFTREESYGTSENGEWFVITTLRYTEDVEIVIE